LRAVPCRQNIPAEAKDINPQAVAGLKPILKKKTKVVAKRGDVIAVPRRMGGYYFVIYLGKNQQGLAYGLLKGHARLPHVPAEWQPEAARQYPLYSGIDELVTGRWQIAARRTDLLSLFPGELERYYQKIDDADGDDMGPFGCAKNAKGELHELTKQEADQIGLLSNEYRSCYSEAFFERTIAEILG
jgi:hypothetical protein